jgi:DNA-binding IclR family transcriptional regulator
MVRSPSVDQSAAGRRLGPDSDEPRRGGIKSIDLAGRILVTLCRNRKAASLSELANQTRIPAAKLHRYMVSLMHMRMVHQDPDTRQYGFGPFALEIGAAAANSSDDLSDAISRQTKLRSLIDETVVFSVWSASGPIILHVEQANHPVITTMKVGSILPVLETAAGIVFASLLPRPITRAVIEREFSAERVLGDPIAKDQRSLARLSLLAQRRGYVHNKGHLLPGVSALASPVWGRTGQLVGVFSVIGQSARIDPSRNEKVLAELLRLTGKQ